MTRTVETALISAQMKAWKYEENVQAEQRKMHELKELVHSICDRRQKDGELTVSRPPRSAAEVLETAIEMMRISTTELHDLQHRVESHPRRSKSQKQRQQFSSLQHKSTGFTFPIMDRDLYSSLFLNADAEQVILSLDHRLIDCNRAFLSTSVLFEGLTREQVIATSLNLGSVIGPNERSQRIMYACLRAAADGKTPEVYTLSSPYELAPEHCLGKLRRNIISCSFEDVPPLGAGVRVPKYYHVVSSVMGWIYRNDPRLPEWVRLDIPEAPKNSDNRLCMYVFPQLSAERIVHPPSNVLITQTTSLTSVAPAPVATPLPPTITASKADSYLADSLSSSAAFSASPISLFAAASSPSLPQLPTAAATAAATWPDTIASFTTPLLSGPFDVTTAFSRPAVDISYMASSSQMPSTLRFVDSNAASASSCAYNTIDLCSPPLHPVSSPMIAPAARIPFTSSMSDIAQNLGVPSYSSPGTY